jgi:hypothetical protein
MTVINGKVFVTRVVGVIPHAPGEKTRHQIRGTVRGGWIHLNCICGSYIKTKSYSRRLPQRRIR